MLLNYLRNRRKKMEMTKRITTILVHLEARRNILISKCLLQIEILLLNEKLNVLKRNQRKPRSCRRFVRNSGWWELVRDTYDANRFFETFRMSRHFLFQFHPPSCKHGKKETSTIMISCVLKSFSQNNRYFVICLYAQTDNTFKVEFNSLI